MEYRHPRAESGSTSTPGGSGRPKLNWDRDLLAAGIGHMGGP